MNKKLAEDANKPDASEEEVVVEGTVSAEETSIQESDGAEVTGESQTDAPADDTKAKYDELVRKYEKDLGAIKSVLDKRISETQKTAEDRERALKAQLDELRKKSMNEDDYKDYEKNRALERIEELQAEVAREKAEKEQVKQFNYYLNMFSRDFGLSENDFKTDGTLEELFNSGMAAVKDNLKKFKETNSSADVTPKAEGKKPPAVAKPSSSPAASALSEEELAKKYADGSVDKLYSMAEHGRTDIAKLITEAARRRTQ
jgi:hypothetical protein